MIDTSKIETITLDASIAGGSAASCAQEFREGATKLADAFDIRVVSAVSGGFFVNTMYTSPDPEPIMRGTAKGLSAAQQRLVDKLVSENEACLKRP